MYWTIVRLDLIMVATLYVMLTYSAVFVEKASQCVSCAGKKNKQTKNRWKSGKCVAKNNL